MVFWNHIKMKLFIAFSCCFIAISAAARVPPLNLEVTEGENVTIHLETAELDRADEVTITRTRGSEKTRIARYCLCAPCEDCNVLEIPGVLLRVKERILILLNVSTSDSGLYEVINIVGNVVSKMNATLNVNKPLFSSSREPPQTSIPKTPNSIERQRLYVLFAPALFIVLVLGLCFFSKCMKESGSDDGLV